MRQTCQCPGCENDGLYRAPRSRDRLREFIWLCLAHVREYNSAWNYFQGMSTEQIEAHRRADTTWHRPTWRPGSWHSAAGLHWHDPLGLLGEDETPRPTPSGEQARMMRIMGLRAGFTLAELRSRYRELVKASHPDLHGGDKSREDTLRAVIEAYRYLLSRRLYA